MVKTVAPFVTSRVFDAPRSRVWKAWTDAEQLKQWWGPKGFVVTRLELDLRPGGSMHYGMRSPDGKEVWGKFVYREIRAPERLVFLNSFSDAKGGVTRHPWNPNWPLQTLSTIELEEEGGKTRVKVTWLPIESSSEVEFKTFDENRDSMKQGWGGTMEQFADYLNKG